MEAEHVEEAQRVHPGFVTALLAGAASGLSVDLLFFPIDTIKTRLQSAEAVSYTHLTLPTILLV